MQALKWTWPVNPYLWQHLCLRYVKNVPVPFLGDSSTNDVLNQGGLFSRDRPRGKLVDWINKMVDWHINFVRISKGGCHWIRLRKRSSQLVLLTDFLRSLLQPGPVTLYLCIWNTKRHVGRAVSLHISTTVYCRSQGVYSVAIHTWIIFSMHYLLLQSCMSKPMFLVQKKIIASLTLAILGS